MKEIVKYVDHRDTLRAKLIDPFASCSIFINLLSTILYRNFTTKFSTLYLSIFHQSYSSSEQCRFTSESRLVLRISSRFIQPGRLFVHSLPRHLAAYTPRVACRDVLLLNISFIHQTVGMHVPGTLADDPRAFCAAHNKARLRACLQTPSRIQCGHASANIRKFFQAAPSAAPPKKRFPSRTFCSDVCSQARS